MTLRNIALIVGSLRKESINRKLATALIKLAPAGFHLEMVRIDDLIILNQDIELMPPDPVVRMQAQIAAADAVLFVTPEHNRSIPSALKNVLDWGSRPYGKSVWTGKPAGLLGASVDATGTAMAQQHLRNMLAALDMPTLGQPEVFFHFTEGLIDAEGTIASHSTRQILQAFVDRYMAWVERFAH